MMKKIIVFLWIISLFPVFATDNYDPLYEAVYKKMSETSNSPYRFTWSPSSKYYAYLFDKDEDGKADLWLYSIEKKQDFLCVNASNLSDKESKEEKQLKERMRVKGGGISFYSFFNNSDNILLSSGGKLYAFDIKTGKTALIPISVSPVLFPKLSQDDKKIAFVSKGEVYCFNLQTNEIQKLTNSAGKNTYNGMAEYVVAEELDRFDGLWWSPNSEELYYTFVDESKMEKIALTSHTKIQPDYTIQNYPFAGKANATVKLFKVNINTKEKKQITYPVREEHYIVKVNFIKNNLLLSILTRNHKNLYYFYYKKDKPKTLIHIKDDKWINLNNHFRYLKEKNGFIYGSEESGFCHLYFYNLKTNAISKLTQGNWMVLDIAGVTEKEIFFTSTIESPIDSVLCKYDFDSNKVVQLQKSGTHYISMTKDCTYYIETKTDYFTPSTTCLVSVKTGEEKPIKQTACNRIDGLTTMISKPVMFKTKDGTTLYGVLDMPKQIDKSKKYPLIVYTYGGPHAQVASNRFSRNFYWHNYLITKGFVVFRMDNRGSSHRGLKFEQAIYKNMGDLELKDQIEGVNYICSEFRFIDKEKVGIWGWSYGGYMTCMAMTKFAGNFKAGVAVAPVTDWHLYDTAYTERYMETPKENKEGYRTSSALTYANKLKGKLLIIHGISDDNVHFQNTELLLNKFIEYGKYPDLMIYPGKKHSIRGRETRKHLFWKITDFFIKNLMENK
jgi:dipeptidyl-peptidase-4